MSGCSLSEELFERFAARVRAGDLNCTLRGRLSPATTVDASSLPRRGTRAWTTLAKRGAVALERGEVAWIVLAGGMATRMGGGVKALLELGAGETFLSRCLAEQERIGVRFGRRPALWFMTSHATEAAIAGALRAAGAHDTATFVQGSAARLTLDGAPFLEAGRPSLYATGHGDLVDCLRASGLLRRFVGDGGRTVFVANLDNLGAVVDPLLLGWHLEHDAVVTSEVVELQPGDRGGVLLRVNHVPRAVEALRIPAGFPAHTAPFFNINSFWFEARALDELRMDWDYFPIEKRLATGSVLQFERLLNEVTAALPTRFLRVPRAGKGSRFLPIKDRGDLERYIRSVARTELLR